MYLYKVCEYSTGILYNTIMYRYVNIVPVYNTTVGRYVNSVSESCVGKGENITPHHTPPGIVNDKLSQHVFMLH